MSEIKVKGKIAYIGDIKQINDKFKIVEFVLETEEKYPQLIKLQSSNDTADKVIKYNKVGDVVEASLNIRGRKWTNKDGVDMYFNTLEAWKVFKEKLEDDDDDDENSLPF